MDYAFRVHLVNKESNTFLGRAVGHAFIELKSPTGITYYELNTNPQFIGGVFTTWTLQTNPILGFDNGSSKWFDGKHNATTNINDFLQDYVGHVESPYIT